MDEIAEAIIRPIPPALTGAALAAHDRDLVPVALLRGRRSWPCVQHPTSEPFPHSHIKGPCPIPPAEGTSHE